MAILEIKNISSVKVESIKVIIEKTNYPKMKKNLSVKKLKKYKKK